MRGTDGSTEGSTEGSTASPVPAGAGAAPVLHLPGQLVDGSQVVLVQDAVPKGIAKAPEKQEGSLRLETLHPTGLLEMGKC